MAVETNPDIEYYIVRVDTSYRVRLPVTLLKQGGWATNTQPIEACLLVGAPGRCRLLPAPELKNDPALQKLQARATAELTSRNANSLVFGDDSSVALALRLQLVKLFPFETAWRFTLPRSLAAVMQIMPGKSDIAALFLQGHIELWTIATLASAMSTPLTELID